MKVGSSKVRITPPIGSPLAGYSNRVSFSTGIHDHLNARILLLDDGAARGGIVACDLIAIMPETAASVRQAAERLGFPGTNVMVCAFHTHSGPTPDLGYRGMETWMQEMSLKVGGSLQRAALRLREANFAYGSNIAEGLTVNRRHPEEGPVDPELLALEWQARDGAMTNLLNYSCHAVVLGPDNTLISADYPGYAMRKIEKEKGGICLFTNGACADINPLTDTLRSKLRANGDIYDRTGGTFAEAKRLGEALALAAQDSLSASKVCQRPVLRFSRHTLKLPIQSRISEREITSRIAELERILPLMEKGGASPERLYRLGLELSFARKARGYVNEGCARSEIQGIGIGDVALIGLPGEIFVETGLKLKRRGRSWGLKLGVVELANDYLGYMPTDQAFREGGYEVQVAKNLGFGPGLERVLLDGADLVMEDIANV